MCGEPIASYDNNELHLGKCGRTHFFTANPVADLFRYVVFVLIVMDA